MFDVLYRHKNVAFSKCQNLMNEQRVKDKSTGFFSVMVDLGSPVTRFRFYHRKKKQMETAMNISVISTDRSLHDLTYRIFLVYSLLITCQLFNVIENK